MRPHYYSVNEYLRSEYGEKLYKLALNGGMSCPNRDGLIDTRGCIFCSAGGSGDFAGDAVGDIESAKALIADKYKGSSFIAYFQSYTNTYAPVSYLRELYTRVIGRSEIKILSIATRPDCLSDEIYGLLEELVSIKPVWVELGLQTIHENTARYIRRGYSLDIYDEAVRRLKSIGIHVITHMIVGLPSEDAHDCIETARHIASVHSDGIKIQLLHILKGTDLAKDYDNGLFDALSLEEYEDILGRVLEELPKDMVIHRITGDGPKKLLIAPLWSANKKFVMNSINTYLSTNNIIQGKIYS